MRNKETVGGIQRHHHRPDLEDWYEENLAEQFILMDKRGMDVIATINKIKALQAINREIDRRLRPCIMPGRVDLFTELNEVN